MSFKKKDDSIYDITKQRYTAMTAQELTDYIKYLLDKSINSSLRGYVGKTPADSNTRKVSCYFEIFEGDYNYDIQYNFNYNFFESYLLPLYQAKGIIDG